jgi:hypothetical protein
MIATYSSLRGGAGFNLPKPGCGRVVLQAPGGRSLRGAAFVLVLALSALSAGCFLQGKQPVAQTTPAAPASPAAKSTAPPQPLSVPQTKVELPPPQPVSDAAVAAGETPQDEPEPAAPPRPPRRTAGPPAINPARPETPAPPAATEEPARAPIQEVLSADERKHLQDSADERKREIRHLMEQAHLRHLNSHELSVLARIEGMVKLSDDAEAKGDMRDADTLAERALVLAKDLESEH